MGSEQWGYFVPYQPDVTKLLRGLRQREFEAGRYNPAQPFPVFLLGPDSPGPGAQHASIEEAIEAAGADGTRSILDIDRVGDDPDYLDAGVAAPVSNELLLDGLGTLQPTRPMIEENLDLFSAGIGRGEAVYVIAYEDGKPSEILFTGFSYD